MEEQNKEVTKKRMPTEKRQEMAEKLIKVLEDNQVTDIKEQRLIITRAYKTVEKKIKG